MHLPDAQVHVALEALWRAGGTVYAGLATTVPDDHVSPGSVTEVVAASYDRVALATDATGFAAAADRAIETIVDTTWAAPAEDWGVLLSVPLYDTATKGTGTPVGAVRLSTGVEVLAGGSAPVAPAGLIRFEAP
jgi:hypothetical protein